MRMVMMRKRKEILIGKKNLGIQRVLPSIRTREGLIILGMKLVLILIWVKV
jgi:hypothetical protein